MPLTNTEIRKAKPARKPVRLFDGGGFYLEISPAGGSIASSVKRSSYRQHGREPTDGVTGNCAADYCSLAHRPPITRERQSLHAWALPARSNLLSRLRPAALRWA